MSATSLFMFLVLAGATGHLVNVFVRGAVPNPLWQGHVRNLPKSATGALPPRNRLQGGEPQVVEL